MNPLLFLPFFVILALLLFSISFGLRFYEGQRRKKLVSMLRTVTENGEEHHVNLLIDENEGKDLAQGVLGELNITERVTRLLSESGLNWTLTKLITFMCVTFLIGAIAGVRIAAPVPVLLRALGAGLCSAFLPLMFVSKKRNKRIAELEAQLPDALDFLSRSMRAGHAFTISLEMVGQEIADPLGQEIRSLFNEQNLGASLERAFSNFSKRVPLPDVQFFSSAVLLQRQTGGNLSEILNRLAQIIRDRFQLKGKVKAVAAHGKLTATILGLLPIATVGGLMLTSPSYLTPMFENSLGKKILAAGVVAQVLGNMVIKKIIRIKV
jgi:tight adherence protein B